MNNKRTILLAGVSIVACFFLLTGQLESSDECSDQEVHAHSEQCEEGDTFPAGSLEERAMIECEHDIPIYQCAKCRYEIGVVKIPGIFLEEASSTGQNLVETVTVERRKVTSSLDVTGEVQLNENASVHISSRIPGIIKAVYVDIGARVNQGDVLFEINSTELGQALSEYERSRAFVDLSRKNFEREKSLFDRQISSEQDMISAQMAFEQHKAELKSVERNLHVLGLTDKDMAAMKQDTPGLEIGTLPVRAPIEGTIIEKHAVIGELVEPGRPVMLLADLQLLWVWANIYEQDLKKILEIQGLGTIPVDVFVAAFPGHPFKGDIDYIGNTMEERTRTVRIRAAVQNEDFLLRPGMFCETRIGIPGMKEALVIPGISLLSDEGNDFVFAHWKDDYFARRPVKRGRQFIEGVEILGGLLPGEVIVSQGAFLLKSDILREKMGAGCAD